MGAVMHPAPCVPTWAGNNSKEGSADENTIVAEVRTADDARAAVMIAANGFALSDFISSTLELMEVP